MQRVNIFSDNVALKCGHVHLRHGDVWKINLALASQVSVRNCIYANDLTPIE